MRNQTADSTGKATRIRLFSFDSPQMRAFHLSWVAFFLCFFAWVGIAPLMAVVRKELHLTPAQIGNLIIASVSATIFARLLVGYLCDRFGPRRTYATLLLLGALPVMGIGLAHDYPTFLLFRLAIGAVGASFVITQHHTSIMFAPNCVGTANATTAGWGNMGGGVAQVAMPLLFSAALGLGMDEFRAWRLAMLIPGVAMILCGIAYFFLTEDAPAGHGPHPASVPSGKPKGSFRDACKDLRVWTLALIYGACFGVEITIHNVATLYFSDSFGIGIKGAGLIVGAFGLLAIFARTLGGWLSDRVGLRHGLPGRVALLAAAVLTQGLLLILFSRMTVLPVAVVSLIAFGLFVHLSCGATYAVIPFINPRAVGSVAGLVGAGGNVGAVLSGLLFTGHLPWTTALLLLGTGITAISCMALLVRFNVAAESAAVSDRGTELTPIPVAA